MRTVTLIEAAQTRRQSFVAGVTVDVPDEQAAQWEAEGKIAAAPAEKPAASRTRAQRAPAGDTPAAEQP